MSGHNQTYYKLKAKQFKDKEEVLEWADEQHARQEKTEHELRETIAWFKEEDKKTEHELRELVAEVKKLKEQLAAQEERTSFIVELLTDSQMHELHKHDYGDDESDDEEEEEEEE